MAILLALIFVALLLLVSGGYVFFVACGRGKEISWLVKEEVEPTPYGKYYECILESDRWLAEHHAQDVYISSRDELKLHGLWVPAPNPRGTVLLVHGYRSTKLVDFGVAFDFYHTRGINLLIPDQRCHGLSEGRYITFGVKESGDILEWIAYHNQNFGMKPMLVSGLSMGASTVMYLADEVLPANVKVIIADCGYTSPWDIISRVFKRVTHLPASPTVWVADIFAQLLAGFGLKDKDSRITLAKNKLPILLVHGTKDDFVPCYMTEESYAFCTGPKQLLLVEGAEHGVSFLVDHERYVAEVERLLKIALEEQ